MERSTREPLIVMEAIKKTYGGAASPVHALDGVDLRILHGEFCAIVGSSGSGKSTLLSILGLLESYDSGSYRLAGTEAARLTFNERAVLRNKYVGFVFQAFNLLNFKSVEKNVLLPLLYSKSVPRSEWPSRVTKALEAVGLASKRHAYPSELSGGQQQRVSIARALVTDPAILLADEPTGNLDSTTSAEIMEILLDLNKRGSTILMVTHDAHNAGMAGRAIRISDGHVVHA